jgi:hypothetical protein
MNLSIIIQLSSVQFKFIHLLTQQAEDQLQKQHKYILRERVIIIIIIIIIPPTEDLRQLNGTKLPAATVLNRKYGYAKCDILTTYAPTYRFYALYR